MEVKWIIPNNCTFKFRVSLHGEYEYHYNFVETPCKFTTIAKLSTGKLGSSSVVREHY